MGAAFSGSPPHFHPPAWNAAVAGARKLWVLFPPEAAFFSSNVTAWEWSLGASCAPPGVVDALTYCVTDCGCVSDKLCRC